MIFVTVGNPTQPFTRLIQGIDVLACQGLFGTEEVFLQTGSHRGPVSSRCERRSFVPDDEFRVLVATCRLLICHGGCGTLIHALREGKRPVVMPRLKKHGEHLNDHQMQVVRALAAQDRIVPAYEVGDLAPAIWEATQRPRLEGRSPSPIVDLVAHAIVELGQGPRGAAGHGSKVL